MTSISPRCAALLALALTVLAGGAAAMQTRPAVRPDTLAAGPAQIPPAGPGVRSAGHRAADPAVGEGPEVGRAQGGAADFDGFLRALSDRLDCRAAPQPPVTPC